MQEGGVFIKLDLMWGYHQIKLSGKSRSITTFVAHKGFFRYKRLVFGISSAPEKYQQVIQQVLQNCDGTANISDDIIVYGPHQVEHDKRLEKVLTRLEERGLTLNQEKCVFDMAKLTFVGLLLSNSGTGPTEEKVRTVLEAREPQNVTEVKSFLGLVNFNARFIPDLAAIAAAKRGTTHVKPFQERESDPEEVELPAQIPEIHPEEKVNTERRENRQLQKKLQRITMNKCQIETRTKKGKVYLLSHRDRCVPDVRQRDMEITL